VVGHVGLGTSGLTGPGPEAPIEQSERQGESIPGLAGSCQPRGGSPVRRGWPCTPLEGEAPRGSGRSRSSPRCSCPPGRRRSSTSGPTPGASSTSPTSRRRRAIRRSPMRRPPTAARFAPSTSRSRLVLRRTGRPIWPRNDESFDPLIRTASRTHGVPGGPREGGDRGRVVLRRVRGVAQGRDGPDAAHARHGPRPRPSTTRSTASRTCRAGRATCASSYERYGDWLRTLAAYNAAPRPSTATTECRLHRDPRVCKASAFVLSSIP